MSAEALRGLLDLLEKAHLPFWFDGGWGVDALLGEQTRHHKDVDLILRVSDVPQVIELLADRGFSIKEGLEPDSFVLADGSGLEADVHAVDFDFEGNGHYRMQNGGTWINPSEGFLGQGSIEGRRVPCLTPAVQVHCHAHGYQPTLKDLEDMRRLEERFAVILPPHLKPQPHTPPTEESA